MVSDQKIYGPTSRPFTGAGKELAPQSGFEWANGEKKRVVCWHLTEPKLFLNIVICIYILHVCMPLKYTENIYESVTPKQN